MADSAVHGMRLDGHRRRVAWLVSAVLAIACLAGFGLALSAGQEREALARSGLASPELASYFTLLELMRMLVYLLCALVIIWRRPNDLIALCTAIVLIAAGAVIPSAAEALALNAGGA